jgi:hypothetical protein
MTASIGARAAAAQAGILVAVSPTAEKSVPVVPTDQVRGLKAQETTVFGVAA